MSTTKNRTTAQATNATNQFLDGLLASNQLKNDAALCQLLGIAPPTMSRIRHGWTAISGDVKIRIHEKTGMSIRDIQEALAA